MKIPKAKRGIPGLIRLFCPGFFLLICFPSTEVFSEEADDGVARQYYEEGLKYLSLGEYGKADEAFKKAEENVDLLAGENPADVPSREEPFLPREEEEESFREQEPVKSISREEYLVSGAKEAYARGDLDKVIECYTDLSRLYPGNAALYYNLGVIFLEKREYGAAARYFEKTVSLSPEDSDAYYNLGVIYGSFLGDKKNALRFYDKYLLFSRDEIEKDKVISWIKELR